MQFTITFAWQMKPKNLLGSFLIWRAKHIPTKHFIIILSIVCGIAGGLGATAIKYMVHGIQHLLFRMRDFIEMDYLYLVFPLVGLIFTALYILYLNRNKLGHGITNILYCINKKAGFIEQDKMYSHVFTSSLTVGFGGSVGLEAPIVTTGSAIGSNIGQMFHLPYKKRLLLIGCGAAAATSAIFAAPITGIVFVLEILLLELSVPSFIPLLLASISGMIVSKILNSAEFVFSLDIAYEFLLREIPLFILLGIVTGLVSIYFTNIVNWMDLQFRRVSGRVRKSVLAGILVGFVIFLFPPLYGEGYDTIQLLLTGQGELLMDDSLFAGLGDKLWILPVFILSIIIFKAIATSLTLSGGGNGGIFAPSLFLGALVGFLFARLFNFTGISYQVNESTFALIAMAGIMSGVMHAPLTGIFLIAEITTGYSLILPLMIVSAVSYATVTFFQPHSIYTQQLALKGQLVTRNKDKEVLNLLPVKRVVEKDLHTIHPEATLGALTEIIKKSKRNIFPVVDESKTLHGIILLDDIREVMFNPDLYETITVKSIMHAPPAYVYLTDEMNVVMKKFEDTGAWNLPVLDGNKYVGFLSKSKIFSIYRTMLIHHTKQE